MTKLIKFDGKYGSDLTTSNGKVLWDLIRTWFEYSFQICSPASDVNIHKYL